MTIDISPEAVERFALLCKNAGFVDCMTTLRALSAALTTSQAETAAAFEAAAMACENHAVKAKGYNLSWRWTMP